MTHPTREELADGFALTDEHQADLPKSAPMTIQQIALRHGFLAGFNAGFARAIGLLRSDEILKYPRPDGYAHRAVYENIAEWLEKKSPTPTVPKEGE